MHPHLHLLPLCCDKDDALPDAMNHHHEVVELDRKTHFIAKCPEGDFMAHSWDPKDQEGCGGESLTFRIGPHHGQTRRTVKGPFLMDRTWQDCKKLVEHLGRPELNDKWTGCKVGKGTEFKHCDTIVRDEDVVFDSGWSIDPVLPKVQSKWNDLLCIVEFRHGSHRASIASFLKWGKEPGSFEQAPFSRFQ